MTEPDVRIHRFVLGPVQTNTYVIGEARTGEAVVIDPAWDGAGLIRAIEDLRLRVTAIWLTHAHFDHVGAAGALADRFGASVAMHPDDRVLWRAKGAAPLFGFADFDAGPPPSVSLVDGMQLHAAGVEVEVRHVPGHSPGHVLFHAPSLRSAFCGDVIFAGGIGRTDLPGGDAGQLQRSLRERVLTLPDETVLYPGHGSSTTVRDERDGNPFLAGD